MDHKRNESLNPSDEGGIHQTQQHSIPQQSTSSITEIDHEIHFNNWEKFFSITFDNAIMMLKFTQNPILNARPFHSH